LLYERQPVFQQRQLGAMGGDVIAENLLPATEQCEAAEQHDACSDATSDFAGEQC